MHANPRYVEAVRISRRDLVIQVALHTAAADIPQICANRSIGFSGILR